MDWFGKSTKVEAKSDIESLGIRFQPIQFHPDRNEYEQLIHLPGCPKNLIKLTYDKPSGELKLNGKKQKTEFVHRFPVPTDCLPTGIYGRFRDDVLHIIMPRSFSEWPDASSKQEDDQKASSDRKPTEQVREHREDLPARVPEPSPSDQKSTEKLTERGKDRDKLPDRVLEPSPSVQKSTEKLTERGKDRDKGTATVSEPSSSDQKSIEKLTEMGKDRDKLLARVLSSSTPSDRETMEKLRQRDNELFPEISAPQPSVRESSSSVRELRDKYQKNIFKISAPPPPPPPTPPSPPPPPPPRAAAPAPWNQKAIKIGSRKEEEEDREPSSVQKKAKLEDVEPEKSVVRFPKKESKLGRKDSKRVEIAMDEQGDIGSEKSAVKSPEKESKSEQEVAENEKIVNESKAKEDESEKKKPSAGGKETAGGLVAKVKETGKAALAAAMKEENRPGVIIGAAVLALLVIGASLRKKPRN